MAAPSRPKGAWLPTNNNWSLSSWLPTSFFTLYGQEHNITFKRDGTIKRITNDACPGYRSQSFIQRSVEHFDPFGFGYEPRERLQFRHVCGFSTSIFVAIIALSIVSLKVYEWAQFTVDVVVSYKTDDGKISFSNEPISEYTLQVGARCCQYSQERTLNDKPCNHSGYLDFDWQQRSVTNQVKQPAISLLAEECFFGTSKTHLALCPHNSEFVIQGTFEAVEYQYLQLNIKTCSNSSAANRALAGVNPYTAAVCFPAEVIEQYLRELDCAFFDEMHSLSNLDEFDEWFVSPKRGQIFEKTTRSKRYNYLKDVRQKVDVFHDLISVFVQPFTIHFDSLISEYKSIMYSHFEYVLETVDREDDSVTFLSLYFRLRDEYQIREVSVIPGETLLDLFGNSGAYVGVVVSLAFIGVSSYNVYMFERHKLEDMITQVKDIVNKRVTFTPAPEKDKVLTKDSARERNQELETSTREDIGQSIRSTSELTT